MENILQRIRAAVNSYGVGIVDQGLLSGTNFIVTLVLARLLSVDEFGVFAMGQVLALYTGVLHISLIGEPFSVNFSRYNGNQLAQYVRWNNVVHVILSVAVTVVLFGCAVLFGVLNQKVAMRILICGGLSAPSYFAIWHTRRLCYALRQDVRAFAGTFSNIVLMAVGLLGLYRLGCLNACTAMGVVFLAGIVLLIPFLLESTRLHKGADERDIHRWRLTHWTYAKWHLGGNAVMGLGQFIAYPILALTGGIGASVALRIVETFYAPINQAITSLGMVVLPRLAVMRETMGVKALHEMLGRMRFLLVCGVAILVVILFLMGESLVVLCFGEKIGSGLGMATILYAGIILLRVIFDMGPALFLRVTQDTRAFFVNGWIVGLAGTLMVGWAAASGGLVVVIMVKGLVLGISGIVFWVYASRGNARRG